MTPDQRRSLPPQAQKQYSERPVTREDVLRLKFDMECDEPNVDGELTVDSRTVNEWAAELGRIADCDGNRYKTVTTAWRKRLLRDHGINLYRAENEGWYVPTTAEILAQANPRLRHIGRTAKKHIREIGVIKPSTDKERMETEHQGQLMHVLTRESKKARMNLIPPTAAAETPRIAPPEKARAEK